MIYRDEQLMPLARMAGVLVILLAAGCAGMDRAPQSEPPKPAAKQEKAPAPAPQQAAATQEKAPAPQEIAVAAKPEPAAPKQDVPVAVVPALPPAVPSAPDSISESAAKPEVLAAKPPAKVSTPAAPKKENAVPPPPKPAAAPLDLTLLEKRLKESDAIGLFTKLTLKNQVNDLVDRFKAYYEGRANTTLAQLREPYDMLILKVLSLLQNEDPSLAKAVVESREAIWGILSDKDKFKDF